jgi:hypothetical protein
MKPSSKQNIVWLALPGILLAVVCLAPFLNKAYTIDDPFFLLEARQILKTPLQPWSFPMCWLGNETCLPHAGMWAVCARQGLMGYFLVPVILAGGAERLAHLLQILLACLVVVEMVMLTLRLGLSRTQASIAGMLVVAIAPFLSMASTAMPDILALALGLTGIERLLAWKDERKWHQAAIAGLALGVAPYARPHLALFLPLGALWLFDNLEIRKTLAQFRQRAVLWTPILLAACVLVAVNVLTLQREVALDTQDLVRLQNIPVNLNAYLLYLAFPIPFAAVWLLAQRRDRKFLLLLVLIPLVMVGVMQFSAVTFLRACELSAELYSLLVLVDMIRTCIRNGDRLGTLLSLWVLMPLSAVIYVNLPLKFMVAVLPAIVLILLRLLSSLAPWRARLAYTAMVLGCVAYSLVLLRADANFADNSHNAASELIAPHVAAGEKVWYGGQWGFYWYAQEAGARISKPGEPGPNPGELLAVGLLEGGDATLKRFPNRELIDWRSYTSPYGRTVGYGAGLYSNRFGYLPWRWNPAATNTYQLWRIH